LWRAAGEQTKQAAAWRETGLKRGPSTMPALQENTMTVRTTRIAFLALAMISCAAATGCDSHAAGIPVPASTIERLEPLGPVNPEIRPPFDETPIGSMETVGARAD
jgi:hypothetical protein